MPSRACTLRSFGVAWPAARASLVAVVLGVLGACDMRPAAPPGGGGDATTPGPDGATTATTHDPDAGALEPDAIESYTPTPPTFACVPGAAPSVSPLRALTRTQYVQTLGDILTWALGDAAAAAVVMAGIEVPLAQIPRDDAKLSGTAATTTQAHVEGHYEAATAIAAALTRDPATLVRV